MNDTEQQRIYEQLQRMVGGAKKKSSLKKTLVEASPDKYKNIYIDDGSMEFEKLKIDVIKNIAQELYGAAGIREMQAVPTSTINKVMKGLRDSYQIKIDNALEDAKYELELANQLRGVHNEVLNREYIAKASTLGDPRDQLTKLRHPNADKYLAINDAIPVQDREALKTNVKNERLALLGQGLEEYEEGGMSLGGRKKKMNITPAERKRRSERMKQMWRDKKK